MPVFFYTPPFAFEQPGLASPSKKPDRASVECMDACPTRLPTTRMRSQPAKGRAPSPFQTLSASGASAFDLLESSDAYVLLTNAPGLSHDDIAIDLMEDTLIISGKKPAAGQQQQQQQQQQQEAAMAQQQKQNWELLPKEGSGSRASEDGDDEDGLVEAADDEDDERVRHPGQHSPKAAAASPEASAGSSPRSSNAGTAAAAAAAPAPERVLFAERRNPTFKRAFKLPDNVRVEDISASLERGVLTVHVPKKPAPLKVQPRRIAVKLVA